MYKILPIHKLPQLARNRVYKFCSNTPKADTSRIKNISVQEYDSLQSKLTEILSLLLGDQFECYAKNSYRGLVRSVARPDQGFLSRYVESSLVGALRGKDGLRVFRFNLNENVGQNWQNQDIQYKVYRSRLILGINADRNLYPSQIIRLGSYPNQAFGLYLGNLQQKQMDIWPCLFQTTFLYKTRTKLDESQQSEVEQVDMIQYQIQGKFNPATTNIFEQLQKCKKSLNWYSMLNPQSSRKLFGQLLMKIMGLNNGNETKQNNQEEDKIIAEDDEKHTLMSKFNWKISDVNGIFGGNCPRLYPREDMQL